MKAISFIVSCTVVISLMANDDNYDPIICNDFAGVETAILRGDPFNGKPRAGQNGQTIDQFILDPFSTLSSQSSEEYALAWLREFHYLAVLMEANAKIGAYNNFRNYADVLSERLRQYDQHILIFGDGVLRRNRLRFEYALSRIVNDRSEASVVVSATDIRQMLPRVTGEIATNAPSWLKKQETFRNMLIIGAEIENYKKKNLHLPMTLVNLDGITKNERIDAWGGSILYSYHGDDWRLFSAGGRRCSDIPADSEVLPEIDRIKGVSTLEVWFSSDFSAKRRMLFDGRAVNHGNPGYECILEGKSVRRR